MVNGCDIVAIRNEYQSLVNRVRTTTKFGCKIVVGTMTPCKQRLDAIGYSQENFLLLNDNIRGIGSNPITGVDARVATHTVLMDDENLKSIYDEGDFIHPNDLGREVNGQSIRSILQSMLLI